MLRYFPTERRRRVAPLFLTAGLFVVGKLAYDEVPRDRELHFIMPDRPVSLLRVTYTSGDELYAGLERRFPNGSPAEVVHTPSLSPGRYDLAIELTADGGETTRLHRSVDVPSAGALRILLAGER